MGPEMEQYICHTVYSIKTRSEPVADTLEFSTEHNKIPGISNQEAGTNAALGIIEAISDPSPTYPFAFIRAKKLQEIKKLADIFKQKLTHRKPPTKKLHKLEWRSNIIIHPRQPHL